MEVKMQGQQLELIDCIRESNLQQQNVINQKAVEQPVKLSSKKRIEQVLFAHGHITNAEAAELLRYSKGQLSFGQRLRDIRKDLQAQGKELNCVPKGNGVFDYVIRKAN